MFRNRRQSKFAQSRFTSARLRINRLLRLSQLEDRTVPATITVTGIGDNTGTDGVVILREAIQSINLGSNLNADVVADTNGGTEPYGTMDKIIFSSLFDSAQTITLDAALAQMDITKALSVNGKGPSLLTINGNGVVPTTTSRIFNVNIAGAATVTLSGMTLTGGNVATGNNGGAILIADEALVLANMLVTKNTAGTAGGAIAVSATGASVSIGDSTFSGNTASATGGGGAIFAPAATSTTITINNSTFTGNTAKATGGGAIGSASTTTTLTLNVTNSTFSSNSATGVGGAIGISGPATVTLNSSTFSGNTATTTGAGIHAGSAGIIGVNTCTFDGNIATSAGGAISTATSITLNITESNFAKNQGTLGGAIRMAGTGMTLNIDKSVISGNISTSTLGGGIYMASAGTVNINSSSIIGNRTAGSGGALRINTHVATIVNSTLADNEANGSTSTTGGGAIFIAGAANLTVRNSTLVNNRVPNATAKGGAIFSNVSTGTITLNSNIIANNFNPDNLSSGSDISSNGTLPRAVAGTKNIIGVHDASIINLTDGAGNNQVGMIGAPLNPRLHALSDYGGLTPTYALVYDSPALNMGNNVSPTISMDQRDEPRPGDTTMTDVGSVEGISNNPFVGASSVVGSVTASGDTVTVTVTYEDETGINLTSLGSNDLVLIGPGTLASIALKSVVPGPMNKVVVATYEITGPAGMWRAIDSGLHTVTVAANSVLDTDGTPNSVVQQSVGTLSVMINGVIVVDNAGDGLDGNLIPGQVSLREAVAAANFTVGGANTITFDSVALNGATITLTTGQLFITDAVMIEGLGSGKLAISGLASVPSATNRIFNVNIPGGTASFTVNGVTLTGCNLVSGGNGGVITLGDDQLTMDDVRFINNTVTTGASAAIAVSTALTTLGNNITATNCDFINNVVTTSNTGGAIVTSGAGIVLFFDNCTFDSNSTGGSGGAIGLTGANVSLTVTNSVFNDNSAGTAGGGGAISASGAGTTIVLTDCTISMNSAGTGGGGAINVTGASNTITLDGSVIAGNSASSFGGAVRTPSSAAVATVNFIDSTFTNNTSTQSGGVLQGGSTITLNVSASTFVGNSAASSGGALNLGNGSTTISMSLFQNNTAGALGGGINFGGGAGNYTLIDSVVKTNSATSSGGGIHAVSGAITKIERTTIAGNTAGDLGGGFASAGGSVTIIASTLSANSAGNGGGGASFVIAAATGIEITNSTVSGNAATGLAAIGGGVHTNATGAGTLNINNSTITRNSAVNGGGGLGFVTNTATVSIASTIIAQNIHDLHPDLFSTPTTPLAFPIVNNSIIGAVTDTDIDLSAGLGNITGTLGAPVNAKLTPLGSYGGPTQTHGPSMGSPALNAGSNPLNLTTDQRGQPRPVDPTQTDIGSFEGELNIPTATVTKMDNITGAGAATYEITVVYADPTNNINTGTIGTSDVTLSGKGFMTPVSPGSFMVTGAGGSVTVTYTFATPGGAWDLTDNGVYTLTMNEDEVANTAGTPLFVQPGVIGNSTVAITTTYVVDKLGDDDDGNYGVGQLTIREAFKLANDVSVLANDTISFDSVVFNGQTIALTGGQLAITDPVVVTGLGSGKLTIRGAAAAAADNRIFNVAVPGGTVNLSGLTLTGGNLSTGNGGAMLISAGTIVASDMVFANNRTANGGGAVAISAVSAGHMFTNSRFVGNSAGTNVAGGTVSGGGMITTSTGIGLVLTNCVFDNNFGNGLGGGLATQGSTTVTINDSAFTRNRAFTEGGGLQGGSTINLTINNSVFANNEAGTRGGGFNVGSGTTVINNSRILDNIAGTEGGGANFPSSSVTYTINGTLIRGNQAAVNGGGIALGPGLLQINNSTLADNVARSVNSGGGGLSIETGSATITNSTLSGNRTDGLGGGGIALITPTWAGALEIRNSTITNNQSPNGAGGGIAGLSSSGFISLSSSIVASNVGNISRDLGFLFPASIGGNDNLIGSNDTSNANFSGINDPLLFGTEASPVDPGLYPLANNGGPTPTHALRIGSKALNAGNDDFILGTDQRGGSFLRVVGIKTDIGAVEGTLIVPIAAATLPNVPPAGVDFVATVVYQDETGINLSSIDTTDVQLSGPGYAMPIAPFKVVTAGSGQLVTANYFFTPPGGSWDVADNGRYTLTLVGTVADTDGLPNTVVNGDLGTFSVDMGRTFVVDIAADEDDGNYLPGDLSLREAVRLANSSYGRNDTITFAPAVFATPQTILLSLGEMAIEESITITGPGKGLLTIDANSASRHFKLDGLGVIDVSISDLTLTKGAQTGSAVLGVGGSILSFIENLTLANVVISGNKAATDGGAIHVLGNANLTISDSTINTNTANRGAGVSLNSNANVSIARTTISGNTSTDDGAGLYFFDSGSLLLDSSTLSGNTSNTATGSGAANSSGGGGAIYFFGGVEIGGFTVVNSTISGNKSTNSRGGGIVLQVFVGNAVIRNSTITGNDGKMGGGIMFARPSNYGSLTLESSIVAVNKAGGVANNAMADLMWEFAGNVGGNNNLIGIMDPANNVTLTGTNNLTGMVGSALNPLLGALADNGGPVFTHALLNGSPAIDVGNQGGLTVDARGVSRPQDFTAIANGAGDGSDIGAYELALAPTVAKIEVNGGDAQRSLVKTIKVTFSEAVDFPMGLAAAFDVSGIGNGALGVVLLDITQNGPDVTITFKTGGAQNVDPGNSLQDGDYRLTIFADKIQGLGGTLDGDNDQISEGNPIDNRTLEFHRLFGDADGNRTVSAADFNAFRLDYGLMGLSIFDFNNDNQVTAADFNQFRLRYGVSLMP